MSTTTEERTGTTALDWAYRTLETLDPVIAHIEATDEDAWQVDIVRSKDGTRNCFFGHLFNMAPDEEKANALWGAFEELWSTTFVIYPINDAPTAKYPQDTPKQRILAYLRALRSGDELTTHQGMEADFQAWLADQPEDVRRQHAQVHGG